MGQYEYFQDWADQYDKTTKELKWSAPKFVSEYVTPIMVNPHRVLDIAIGTGDLTLELKKSFPDAEYYGVDLSDKMMQNALAKGATNNLIRTNVETCRMPFQDSIFDASVSSGLGEFIEEPSLLINEMIRITNPRGVIAITCHREELNNRNSVSIKIKDEFSRLGIEHYKVTDFPAYQHNIGVTVYYSLFVVKLGSCN